MRILTHKGLHLSVESFKALNLLIRYTPVTAKGAQVAEQMGRGRLKGESAERVTNI